MIGNEDDDDKKKIDEKKEGTSLPEDDEDGMRAIEIIEACYRSSRSGSVIELPLA